MLTRYPHQQKAVRMLMNSYAKDRLAHAYLFEGEPGTPKRELALDFAKFLYCEAEHKPCDHCVNCLRIDHLNHPNVLLIEPEGQSIKKEQILDLQREYMKTTLEEGPKIYIIDQIDKMSASAANSILKFIEEPVANTHTILITDNLHQILPTIISRCQVLNFQPINRQHLAEQLESAGVDAEKANIVVNLTNNFDHAKQLSESPDFQAIVELVTLIGKNLLKNQDVLIPLAESPLDLYNDKGLLVYFLDVLLLFFTEVEKYKAGNAQIVFHDHMSDIQDVINTIDNQTIIRMIRDIIAAKIALDYNANTILLLDNLLIRMSKVMNHDRS